MGGASPVAGRSRVVTGRSGSRAVHPRVDQLGNDNLDVRLGGIYLIGKIAIPEEPPGDALERIARDSETDMPTVVEVLAAFVRGHSPCVATARTRVNRLIRRLLPAHRLPRQVRHSNPAADIQATLTVLGRMERKPGSAVVDLVNTDLQGAYLAGARLNGAYLTDARLDGAYLVGAPLEGEERYSAQADDNTKWPNGFDPEAEGVVFVDREEPNDGEETG